MGKNSFRNQKQNIKTAKGRKVASTKWLHRHLNDPYVNLSKQYGYRSRAAFKLIEIDQKFRILNKVKNVIDLGAAPGGWLQVVKERAKGAKVIGIDLQEIEPIEGVTLITGDFLELAYKGEFQCGLPEKFDLVLSDMACNSCGNRQIDHLRIVELVEVALEFALFKLGEGGNFIAKLLKGKDEKIILDKARKYFSSVKYFKPKASYADSSELYLICMNFAGNTL